MKQFKTPVAAQKVGIAYTHLISLLRSNRVVPPEKDSSGDYVWTDADLERIRQALKKPKRSKSKVK